jgi:hypothetical protein
VANASTSQDFNMELRKKLSADWELALTYINLVYDIETGAGQGGQTDGLRRHVHPGRPAQLHDKNSLRFELQHLSTKQDHGDWATAVAEFTFSPHWFLAAMDQYNYGGDREETGGGQSHTTRSVPSATSAAAAASP